MGHQQDHWKSITDRLVERLEEENDGDFPDPSDFKEIWERHAGQPFTPIVFAYVMHHTELRRHYGSNLTSEDFGVFNRHGKGVKLKNSRSKKTVFI